jgi:2-keto-4-pentenoate hydratase/2-oxohepta-3-ene-1,7-dioic acid hydratase in catechol pathway
VIPCVETVAHDGRYVLALRVDGGHVPVRDHATFAEFVADWDRAWPALAELARSPASIIRATSVPMWRPRKVVCAGANYYKHLVEMDVHFEKDATKAPFFFLKPPTALAGPGTIAVDPTIAMLDWEVELVAVIGRGGRDIAVADALAHVVGYTVAIDVTARDRLFQPDSIFKFDFFAGKGQDGFCPIANGLLPAAFVPDPQATRLALAVNGVTKQDASTSDMIYGVAELIAWASRLVELEPGDLLLTGSPEGVGFPRREFLRAGDVMRAELAGLGAFEVVVAHRGAEARA